MSAPNAPKVARVIYCWTSFFLRVKIDFAVCLHPSLPPILRHSTQAATCCFCDLLLLQQGELKQVTDQAMQSRTTVLRHYPGEESNEEYKATIDKSDPSDEEPIAQQQGGLTRKRAYTRQRYENCGQCDEEYAAMDNKEDSCVWHDEELEIDEEADDAWEGWTGRHRPEP